MPDPFLPASVRLGLREPDLLQAGIPSHMRGEIASWLMRWLDSNETDGAVAALLVNLGHVPSATRDERSPRTGEFESVRFSDRDSLEEYIRDSPDSNRVLDMLDWAVRRNRGAFSRDDVAGLRLILERGSSRWTVGPQNQGIQARVTDEEVAAYSQALAPTDEAAKDLTDAWQHAYGIRPNPSDAWDHAIKAIEWLLPAVVAPKDESPRLGKLLDIMRMKPEKWAFKLDTTDRDVTSVRTMIAMMGLVWGNPDRHGAGSSRPPTQEEAEAIVRMAVTVVGLLRSGTLRLVL